MYTTISMPHKKPARGFTLIELVLSLAIGAFVASMVLGVIIPGMRYIREVRAEERLHANAVFLADALTYWVKQGEALSLHDSSTLAVHLPDSSTKLIAKDGDVIRFDGVQFTATDIQMIELLFTRLDKSIRIQYTMREEQSGKTISITTTVAQRNSI